MICLLESFAQNQKLWILKIFGPQEDLYLKKYIEDRRKLNKNIF